MIADLSMPQESPFGFASPRRRETRLQGWTHTRRNDNIEVNAMTTVEIDSKKQEHKSAKKKQKSFRPTNIGTPQAPLRPRQTKQHEPELLSDWEHAS